MSYVTQVIAASLRDARTAKGLSQRDLSALAGIPQAQISRIEAGTVDPRVTSLIAIANALDLELALVPRKAVPAVKSIVPAWRRPMTSCRRFPTSQETGRR